jgi:hypothetical protein
VIHRWGDHDGIGKSVGFWGNFFTLSGTQFDKATILQTKVADVLRLGGKARVNNYLDKTYKYAKKTNISRNFQILINRNRLRENHTPHSPFLVLKYFLI